MIISIDFFLKPFQGASQNGVKGFLKGSYQAVSGIFVKPLTGLLDAASKTAEGIRYASNLNNEIDLMRRIRLPRVFYGKEKFLKSYLPLDAEVYAFLQSEEKGHHAAVNYIDTILINQESERDMIWLIITVEKLLFVSGSTQKMVLAPAMTNIRSVKSYKECIQFQFFKPEKRELSQSGSFIEESTAPIVGRIRNKDEQLVIVNNAPKINSYIEKLVINVIKYYNIDGDYQ